MSILILMIPLSLLLGTGFLFAFLWSSEKGQFDDLDTPAYRILEKDVNERKNA